MVKVLLAHGADPNLRTEDGSTPLHFAAEKNAEIVRLLLEAGAEVNVCANISRSDEEGEGDSSDEDEEAEEGTVFGYRASGETPLLVAAEEGNCNVCRVLLEHGSDVLAMNAEGQTALHHAVSHNNVELCRVLLEAGADPDAMNISGDSFHSPLHVAASLNADVCLLLLEYGANVLLRDSFGDLPLHRAVKAQQEQIVRTLLNCSCVKRAKSTDFFAAREAAISQQLVPIKPNKSSALFLLQQQSNHQEEPLPLCNDGDALWRSFFPFACESIEEKNDDELREKQLQLRNADGVTATECLPPKANGEPYSLEQDKLRLAIFGGGVRSLKEYSAISIIQNDLPFLVNQQLSLMTVGADLTEYIAETQRTYFPQLSKYVAQRIAETKDEERIGISPARQRASEKRIKDKHKRISKKTQKKEKKRLAKAKKEKQNEKQQQNGGVPLRKRGKSLSFSVLLPRRRHSVNNINHNNEEEKENDTEKKRPSSARRRRTTLSSSTSSTTRTIPTTESSQLLRASTGGLS
ncbi:E3 ubiquitin-protein ligase HTD1, variant 3 [Balamuthia mandrillaris]